MKIQLLTYLNLAAGGIAAPRAAGSDCTREALRANTETYIAAQSAGKPENLLALGTKNTTYVENTIVKDIKTGILSQPLKIDHNRSTIDTTQCATYTELIITDAKNPHVIGTQMRFSGEKLSKVETLVTQAGDWAFNATGTLYYASREDGQWGTIPEKERDSRAVIQAAADAYLDLFNNKSVIVPWGTPCSRLEGSWYTGKGLANDTCNIGVPSGVRISERRYVIDDTVGTVDAFVKFATRPDSHEFRIEKGKIRFVHTITVMRNITSKRWTS